MTKIKICGLSRECDIEYVNEAQPEYIGFVFAESRRKVSKTIAAKLKKRLNPGIEAAGVFVNADIAEIRAIFEEGIIDIVQLHGDESEDYIKKLRESCPAPIIKAFIVQSGEDVRKAVRTEANFLLLDSGAGSGKTFDWSALSFMPRPFILAGGLTAENIREAVNTVCPYAVDLSSGVETDGFKDREKIMRAVAEAKYVKR